MTDDLVKRLRERPYRRGFETEYDAKARRQSEREEAAARIEQLTADLTAERELKDYAYTLLTDEATKCEAALAALRDARTYVTWALNGEYNGAKETLAAIDAVLGERND